MARATPVRSPDASTTDASLPFAEWFDSQQRLWTVTMSQWTGLQELWLRGVYQQLDAWNALWQTDIAEPSKPTWADLPVACTEAMQRAAQAWWGPWLPMVQRGTEQLA